MGGNALKHLSPLRITSDQMQQLWARIQLACLLGKYDRPMFLVPWPALSKHEHGDMDILVDDDARAFTDLQNPLRDLGVVIPQVIRNGNVYSVPVPFEGGLVQVDLILAHESFSHHRLYYAGGGFGAMVGRIADHMGLVFAMDGLRLRCTGEPWSKDINLTSDPETSLRVLGYTNPITLLRGMTAGTEPELWEFVMTSPYAKPECFMPENTNADNRSRDRARPSYLRFQKWLQGRYPQIDASPPLPRWTYAEIENHICCVLGETALQTVRRARESAKENYESKKLWAARWGRLAVDRVFDAVSDADRGAVIQQMQKYLPHKDNRFRFPDSEIDRIADNAALLAGWDLGLRVKAQ